MGNSISRAPCEPVGARGACARRPATVLDARVAVEYFGAFKIVTVSGAGLCGAVFKNTAECAAARRACRLVSGSSDLKSSPTPFCIGAAGYRLGSPTLQSYMSYHERGRDSDCGVGTWGKGGGAP